MKVCVLFVNLVVFFTTVMGQQFVSHKTTPFCDSLQLHIWYPGTTAIENFGEYFVETSISHLSTQRASKIEEYLYVYLSDHVFGVKVNVSDLGKTKVKRDVLKDIPSKMPLVIYSPGYRGLPFENSLLCEFLSGQGYVVASIPALGVHNTTDSIGLEIQASYIENAIRYFSSKSNIDTTRISLIGFSWGGLSSILTAMRNNSVKSVVSLDGSIRYFYPLAEKMQGFNPKVFNKPILLFGADGNDDLDLKFFNQLQFAPATLIKMDTFDHFDFISFRFLPSVYQDVRKSIVYNKMLEIINNFLQTQEKGGYLKAELVNTTPTIRMYHGGFYTKH